MGSKARRVKIKETGNNVEKARRYYSQWYLTMANYLI